MDAVLTGFDIADITNNAFYVVLFMIGFDVLTGTLVAGKEKKINSSISFDGLLRKFGLIVALFFTTFVDSYFHMDGTITNMGITMVLIYEGISVIENFSRIGVNLDFLSRFFDKDKVGRNEEK